MQKNGIEMLSHGRGAQLRPWGSLTPAMTRGPRPRPTWQADLAPPVMVDLAPPSMEKRKRRLSAMGKTKRRSRRHPGGRGSRSHGTGHGEEEEELPGHGEEEEELAGHGEDGRWPRRRGIGARSAARPPSKGRGRSPATRKRGAGRRRRGTGHSRRRSPVADGEEGTGPLPSGRGRAEEGARRPRRRGRSRTVKRQSGPIPLNTEGSGSVLGYAPFSYSSIPRNWIFNVKSQFHVHPNNSIEET